MAAFIKRTRNGVADPLHLAYLPIAHTPDYTPPNTSDWLMDPDLSGVVGVAQKYWEVVGESVVAMSQNDQDAVDAAVLGVHNTNTEALIISRLHPIAPLAGIAANVAVAALTFTVDINSVIVNDQTTVVADPEGTSTFKVCYIHNVTSETLSIEVFEKVNGLYGALANDEELAADLGEWQVIANGGVLTPV